VHAAVAVIRRNILSTVGAACLNSLERLSSTEEGERKHAVRMRNGNREQKCQKLEINGGRRCGFYEGVF
jgi:hypothetical protein